MILFKRVNGGVESTQINSIVVAPEGAMIRAAADEAEFMLRDFWLDILDAAIDEISENKA